MDLFSHEEAEIAVLRTLEVKWLTEIKNIIAGLDKSNYLQNKINSWENINSYNNYLQLEANRNIKNEINQLYNDYVQYLDSDASLFKKRFPKEVFQLTFELVMAKFLAHISDVTLMSRSIDNPHNNESPDIYFTYNDDKGSQYKVFLECTSIRTSLLPAYIKLIPKFNEYFKVAEFFYEKFRGSRKPWHIHAQVNWNLLIKHNMFCSWKKFEEWLYLTRYMYCYFEELILPEQLIALKKIGLVKQCSIYDVRKSEKDRKTPIDSEFIIDKVADTILDKLTKPYFQTSQSGIIAFTLDALSPDPVTNIDIFTQIQEGAFSSNVLFSLRKRMASNKYEIDKINKAISNLYAIIIDVSWLNWFPEISIKKYAAQFPDGFNNTYCVIYNTAFSGELQNIHLFKKAIPYESSIAFELPICLL